MDQKQLIRVDNWDSTTLNRMQQFFFHSKHCDLTLRFRNNTALTVHRLIMRMYTDYFDRLVAHYNSTESVMMPRTLQSDVALPIIKFFYTGSIEFDDHQLSALLQAANLMRVPILVKLLELHQANNNQAKIVTKLTTLTEKKSIVHPLFANRDITVNVLDTKHKTMAQAADMSMVKKIKLCEKTGEKKKKKKKKMMDGDTNITNDDSQMSDSISSAIRNGDAMDGPLQLTSFGQISYDDIVDNISINEYASGDESNIQSSTSRMAAVVSVTSEFPAPTSTVNTAPRQSFDKYIDFPVHDLTDDQFFALDNIDLNDFSTDSKNVSIIELSSDSELFDVIEFEDFE